MQRNSVKLKKGMHTRVLSLLVPCFLLLPACLSAAAEPEELFNDKLAVQASSTAGFVRQAMPLPVDGIAGKTSPPEAAPFPGKVIGLLNPLTQTSSPIIIDNDELQETEGTIEYKPLSTAGNGVRVKTGARFPVVVTSQITSKTARVNDQVRARLKYDLKIGDRLIAAKGSSVSGHLNYVLRARTQLHSLVSPERWYRNSGALGIVFDEIVNEKGEHLPLTAQPARQPRVVKNKGEGRELGVNHHGQVTGLWSQQLKYKAVRIGLNAALAPAGVFSFGAMPVALGVIGATYPSFAFMKPVGLNVRHRRLKGFAWGFLSGFPGSWLIEDTTIRGQEAVIKPGDEFLVEFEKEFTGEPASDAELMPDATTAVQGRIISPAKHGKRRPGKH